MSMQEMLEFARVGHENRSTPGPSTTSHLTFDQLRAKLERSAFVSAIKTHVGPIARLWKANPW